MAQNYFETTEISKHHHQLSARNREANSAIILGALKVLAGFFKAKRSDGVKQRIDENVRGWALRQHTDKSHLLSKTKSSLADLWMNFVLQDEEGQDTSRSQLCHGANLNKTLAVLYAQQGSDNFAHIIPR